MQDVELAVSYLKAGKVIALPTETVYGLAAASQNEAAIDKIYELKSRPNFNPLISHYANISEIAKDVELDNRAEKLLKHFSPGPLTLVLNKKTQSRISAKCSANLKTAAVRIPNNKKTLTILEKFAAPVAAPSANISGKLSPTSKTHVETYFKDSIPLIVDGGDSQIGLESTILDLSSDKAILLRYGYITSQEIEKVLGETVFLKDESGEIKAPGMLLRHYAPKCKLRTNDGNAQSNEALISFGKTQTTPGFQEVINLSENGDLAQAAQNLFSSIFKLEQKNYTSIAIDPIPNEGIGLAINDRLSRAMAT